MVFLSTECVAKKLALLQNKTDRQKKEEKRKAALKQAQKIAEAAAKAIEKEEREEEREKQKRDKRTPEDVTDKEKEVKTVKIDQETQQLLQNEFNVEHKNCQDENADLVPVTADFSGTRKKVELTPHQEMLTKTIMKQRRALAYWRTGAGKTFAGISVAMQFLQYPDSAVVVFAPKAVVDGWYSKLVFSTDYKKSKQAKLGEAKYAETKNGNVIVASNFDQFNNDVKRNQLISLLNGKRVCFIIDELHEKLGSGGTFTKNLFALFDNTTKQEENWILGLSATPFKLFYLTFFVFLAIVNYFTAQSLGDNYQQAFAVLKGNFETQTEKEDEISNDDVQAFAKVCLRNIDQFSCVLSCYHETNDFFPEYDLYTVKVDDTSKCKQLFMQLAGVQPVDTMFQNSKKKTYTHILGKDLTNKTDDLTGLIAHEFDNFLELAKSNIANKMFYAALRCALNQRKKEKTLVFFTNTLPLFVFAHMLHLINVNYSTKTGEKVKGVPDDIEKTFNETPGYVAVMNTKAGGTGLDFRDVKHIYFLQLPPSPIIFYQNIGRGIRYKGFTGPRELAKVSIEILFEGNERRTGLLKNVKSFEKFFTSTQKLCFNGGARLRGQVETFNYLATQLSKKPVIKECETIDMKEIEDETDSGE